MRYKHKTNQGLSLVELMVVVSILGVLTVAISEKVGEYKAKARDSNGIATLHNLKKIIDAHYFDTGQTPAVRVHGKACANQPTGGNHYHPDCMSEIKGMFATGEIPEDLLKGVAEKSLIGTSHHYLYYDYAPNGGGPVVGIRLEVTRKNSCSFPNGSWCSYPTSYCLCDTLPPPP